MQGSHERLLGVPHVVFRRSPWFQLARQAERCPVFAAAQGWPVTDTQF